MLVSWGTGQLASLVTLGTNLVAGFQHVCKLWPDSSEVPGPNLERERTVEYHNIGSWRSLETLPTS